jgi:hypothetical protein
MDPVTTIAGTAAITIATEKFVEGAWESGKRWLAARYESHKEKALQKAQENAGSFLEKLRVMVETLEKEGKVPPEVVERALENPGFAIFLQQALTAAAETEEPEKHDLLARLVSERLAAPTESLLALTSRTALEVIPSLSLTQLKVLGLKATIAWLVPKGQPADGTPQDELHRWFLDWLAVVWAPYRDLRFRWLDLDYLEARACLRHQERAEYALPWLINVKRVGLGFKASDLVASESGESVATLWEVGQLCRYTLTALGALIGLYVSDLLTGQKTSLEDWE